MRLKRIKLRNFRNLSHLELEPDEGYNVIYGPNAAGKTNLCEAIYYTARGWLLKGERQRDLISWKADQALIELELEGDVIKIILRRHEQAKQVELNGKRSGVKGIQKRLRVVAFTPADLRVIEGRPRERRWFIDTALTELDLEYRYQRQRYEQVVRRKNVLLKQERPDEELLQVYNQELIDLGTELIVRRLDYLRLLNNTLRALSEELKLNSAGLFQLEYRPELPGLRQELRSQLQSQSATVREWLARELTRQAALERRRGFALVGPHRDDLRFLRVASGARVGDGSGREQAIDLGRFGSQGERRLALILLKLAQLELHRARYGDYPVLILDDLLSELDPKRAELLLSMLPTDMQVFLTYTELTERLRRLSGRFFYVENGRVAARRELQATKTGKLGS